MNKCGTGSGFCVERKKCVNGFLEQTHCTVYSEAVVNEACGKRMEKEKDPRA